MKITIVGLGYIGLPTALLLAKYSEFEIYGYDINQEKIKSLNEGSCYIKEKEVLELFEEVKEKIIFTNKLFKSDAYILTLPTPLTKDKRCDCSYIYAALDKLMPWIDENTLVILESTVKVGTTYEVYEYIKSKISKDFLMAYVSEKAIPGNTIYEMIHNDRIIGVMNEASKRITLNIYSSFVKGELIVTDPNTAEMVKLFENSYRDVNIALANEFYMIARNYGIDPYHVIELANRHPRVNILSPGPGVGGHCIPIDPYFLIEDFKNKEKTLIFRAREINEEKPLFVANQIKKIWKENNLKNKKVALLGAAYKENVDDDRESPAYVIKEQLEKDRFEVILFDPYVKKENVIYNLEELFKYKFWVLLVAHNIFLEFIEQNKNRCKNVILYDTKGRFKKYKNEFEKYYL